LQVLLAVSVCFADVVLIEQFIMSNITWFSSTFYNAVRYWPNYTAMLFSVLVFVLYLNISSTAMCKITSFLIYKSFASFLEIFSFSLCIYKAVKVYWSSNFGHDLDIPLADGNCQKATWASKGTCLQLSYMHGPFGRRNVDKVWSYFLQGLYQGCYKCSG
jgi:hypothetical protein